MISASSTLERSLPTRHKFDLDTGHPSDLDQGRRGNPTKTTAGKKAGIWDNLARISVWEFEHSNHTVFPAETIYSIATLKQKSHPSAMHFTAALKDTQMVSSPIESVNHILHVLCSRQQS